MVTGARYIALGTREFVGGRHGINSLKGVFVDIVHAFYLCLGTQGFWPVRVIKRFIGFCYLGGFDGCLPRQTFCCCGLCEGHCGLYTVYRYWDLKRWNTLLRFDNQLRAWHTLRVHGIRFLSVHNGDV